MIRSHFENIKESQSSSTKKLRCRRLTVPYNYRLGSSLFYNPIVVNELYSGSAELIDETGKRGNKDDRDRNSRDGEKIAKRARIKPPVVGSSSSFPPISLFFKFAVSRVWRMEKKIACQ